MEFLNKNAALSGGHTGEGADDSSIFQSQTKSQRAPRLQNFSVSRVSAPLLTCFTTECPYQFAESQDRLLFSGRSPHMKMFKMFK